jgi:hypothetical protein
MATLLNHWMVDVGQTIPVEMTVDAEQLEH